MSLDGQRRLDVNRENADTGIVITSRPHWRLLLAPRCLQHLGATILTESFGAQAQNLPHPAQLPEKHVAPPH
jgi:hypothetical protein